MYSSKSVKKRPYLTALQTSTKYFFLIYKSRNVFTPTQTYDVEKEHLHLGINETSRRIKEQYNSTKLSKGRQFHNKLSIIPTNKNMSKPRQLTCHYRDLKNTLRKTQHCHFGNSRENFFLNLRDEFTKFSKANAISDKSAKTIASTFLLFSQHLGTPLHIHCNYGREFDNTLFKDLYKLFDIKITYSSVEHHETKGSLERFHSTLLQMIKIHTSNHPDEHPLNCIVVIAYNNSKNKKQVSHRLNLSSGHFSTPPETLYIQSGITNNEIHSSPEHTYLNILQTGSNKSSKTKGKERFDQQFSEDQETFKPVTKST